VAGEYVETGKVESNVQLPLIDEVWYYQNALSALVTPQRASGTGSRKVARVLFGEVAPLEFFPGCKLID
jgi:hypothetical protein